MMKPTVVLHPIAGNILCEVLTDRSTASRYGTRTSSMQSASS
jgi:hypothetical protein